MVAETREATLFENHQNSLSTRRNEKTRGGLTQNDPSISLAQHVDLVFLASFWTCRDLFGPDKI